MNRYICDGCGEEFEEWPYYLIKTEGKIFCSGRLAEFLREFEPEFFEELAAQNECVSDEAIEEEVWRTIDCAPADVQPVMIDWLRDSMID